MPLWGTNYNENFLIKRRLLELMSTKKEIIRKAAIEVMAREGFYHATSDKIAAEAGISTGSIYYYFENKEEILAYIFQVEFEKRAHILKEIKKSSIHPLFKIKNMLEYHFEHVKEDDKVTKIILREKHLPFSIPGGVKKLGGIPKFVQEILEEGKSSGQIRPCDTEVVSMAIFGIIESITGRYILEKDEGKESNILEKALQEITNLLWEGLLLEKNK